MKNNIYAKVILSALFVGLNALVAFAEVPDLESKVARAAAEAALQRGENPYEVAISLHWKKEVTLGDMMMRAPRRPARKEQVIQVKQKDTVCRGILAQQGSQVLMPAACLKEGKFQLDNFTLQFNNGQSAFKLPGDVEIKGEIAWVPVSTRLTAGSPSAAIANIPRGKTLQDNYGAEMTSHLRSFFHARNVRVLARTRPGMNVSRPLLKVGDALIYQGKVVALVKKVVSSYSSSFGGVSESAFAVIR